MLLYTVRTFLGVNTTITRFADGEFTYKKTGEEIAGFPKQTN